MARAQSGFELGADDCHKPLPWERLYAESCESPSEAPTWDCLGDPRFPGGWGGGLNTERPVTMVVAVGQVRSDADGGRDGEELTDLRYSLELESKHLLIE